MNLPQELLDEIFSHLSDRARPSTLRSCSLVSKSWLTPSRRLLFSRISIDVNKYQPWLEQIPPTNTALLRHARTLTYFIQGYEINDLRYHVCLLRDYLPSFCQLQTLNLCNLDIEPTIPDDLHLFSAFQHTLSSLSFSWVTIAWSSFVALVGNFPQLRKLEIIGTSFREDERPVPEVSHVLCGKLFVDLFTKRSMGLPSHRFAELKPEYEELEILGTYEHNLIAAVEKTLKSLKINLHDSKSTPGLSRCPELRQLAFAMAQPREEERSLISSITSKNFQKLIFIVHRLTRDSCLDPGWIPFDDMICALVGRLQKSGNKNTLEVELQADTAEADEEGRHEKFLPKFREKGRVRIVDVSSGRLWE